MAGMNEASLSVQPAVQLKAASLGAEGLAWLRALPDLVADLERRWSVTVDRSLSGGTAAYVARARTTVDLRVVVMKISVPDPDLGDEIGTLARAEGRGYVRLLAHDVGLQAMLLEALGPSMGQAALSPEMQIDTLCHLLAQAWAVPPAEYGDLTAAHDKASSLTRLVNRLWEDLDHPCSEQAFAQALLFAERRAAVFHPDRCVPVHGDAAPANALQVLQPRPGAETGFVFVDPDGSSGIPRTTSGSPSATGAPNCWHATTRPNWLGSTAGCWPPAAASTNKPSGSGASSSGCRPACTRWRWAPTSWVSPSWTPPSSCSDSRRDRRRPCANSGSCRASPRSTTLGVPRSEPPVIQDHDGCSSPSGVPAGVSLAERTTARTPRPVVTPKNGMRS